LKDDLFLWLYQTYIFTTDIPFPFSNPEFEKKLNMARFPLMKAAETGSSTKNDYNEAVPKLASWHHGKTS
jgi:hypothetical protein